jgi:hypothetical protein
MTLYFLQQRSAPVIPSLQDKRLKTVTRAHDGHDVSFSTDISAAQALVSADAKGRAKALAAIDNSNESEDEEDNGKVDTSKKSTKGNKSKKKKANRASGAAADNLGSVGVADDATLADLLFEFFRFYAYEFSLKDDMVCPRLGYAKVPRGQQHLKPKWR